MGTQSSNAGPIPTIPKSIRQLLKHSSNDFVVKANQMIGRLNAVSSALPSRYGWRFRSVEALQAEVSEMMVEATDCLPANELYWRDALGNWEAHSVMSIFRVIDISRSCVWAMGRHDVVCAGLLARSALETSVANVDAARKVSSVVKEVLSSLESEGGLRSKLYGSTELEEISLKTIFASKLPESEDIYNPTNIVTILGRLSRAPGTKFIKEFYEILCEIAHPNWLGRSLYLQQAELGRWEGNELRTIERKVGPAWTTLAEPVVGALAWSCAAQVSAFQAINQATSQMLIQIEAARRTQ